MKRLFDLTFGVLVFVVLAIPMLIIALLVRWTSRGPALYWSQRIGQHNSHFLMPKFRSMRTDTPQLATHLMTNPQLYLTPIGSFIRKTSLDELPQLFSVLAGHMSFVGPRPALFNQDDLVALRTAANVHTLKPGITGWAQINGRDEIPIPQKVKFDEYYLQHQSVLLDIKIIFLTAKKVVFRDGISH